MKVLRNSMASMASFIFLLLSFSLNPDANGQFFKIDTGEGVKGIIQKNKIRVFKTWESCF